MRFTLKTLLKFVTALSLYLAVAHSAGYAVTLAVVACYSTLRWACRSRHAGFWLAARGAVAILSCVAIWFFAFDWSWFIWECDDCRSSNSHAHYRVLGINVTADPMHRESIFQTALRDMGVPCRHQNASDWHKHRWWGGVWCVCPCWNGTYGLLGDDTRYTDSIASRLRDRAEKEPEFAKEAYRQIVKEHRYAYFWDAIMADQMVFDSLNEWQSTEARKWLELAIIAPELGSGEKSKADIRGLVEQCYELGAAEVIVFDVDYMPALKIGEIFYDEDVVSLVYWMGARKKFVVETVMVQDANYLAVRLPADANRRANVFEWNLKYSQSCGYQGARDYGQEFLLLDL